MEYYDVEAAIDAWWRTKPRWDVAAGVYERMEICWGRWFYYDQCGLSHKQLLGSLNLCYEEACLESSLSAFAQDKAMYERMKTIDATVVEKPSYVEPPAIAEDNDWVGVFILKLVAATLVAFAILVAGVFMPSLWLFLIFVPCIFLRGNKDDGSERHRKQAWKQFYDAQYAHWARVEQALQSRR